MPKSIDDLKRATKVIIVAEDERIVRIVTVEVLRDEDSSGGRLSTRRSAGIFEDKASDIHLLFTDLHMPGLVSGLGLPRRVRGRWPWKGVIVTSGRGTMRLADVPAGCRYLSKP